MLTGKLLLLSAGLFFSSILIVSSTIWIGTGTLGAKFPEPYPPIFYFSFVIYSLQGLLLLARFTGGKISQVETIGYVACSLLASYSAYELVFKLSFPLLEPTPQRITHLITFDLYPMVYLSTSFLVFLATRKFWSWNRLFFVNLFVAILLWLSWWATSFPLKIWEYEKTAEFFPLMFNISTKASTSMLFVTVFKSDSTSRSGITSKSSYDTMRGRVGNHDLWK